MSNKQFESKKYSERLLEELRKLFKADWTDVSKITANTEGLTDDELEMIDITIKIIAEVQSNLENQVDNKVDTKNLEEQLMIMYDIVNSSPNYITYRKMSGECLFINNGAEEMTGYTRDELKKDCYNLLFGSKADEYHDTLIKTLNRKGAAKFRVKGTIKDGSVKTFEGFSTLIDQDEFSTTMFDITDIVHMQETLEDTNTRLKLMLDSSPVCAQVWDKNLSTVDCNEAALKLYGFDNKYEYVSNFIEHCSPEFQPDGQRSDEKAVNLVHRAFNEGICVFDWMHKMPFKDELIPAEITLVKVKLIDDDVVIGYTIDKREQAVMMKELEYHQKMLLSINNSAVILLSIEANDDIDEAILKCLDLMGSCINAERISIWQVKNFEEEETVMTKRVQWLNNNVSHIINNSIDTISPFTAVPEWKEKFLKGEPTSGIVSKMAFKEKKFLSSYGVKSVLALPIIIKSGPWGLLLIDNYYIEHEFTYNEIDTLKTFVFLLASQVYHLDSHVTPKK